MSATHGHCSGGGSSPTYRVWYSMRHRCENPKNKRFASYGGRGISVCDRWTTFSNFLEDMGERPAGMSIDRIDNGKGYSPDNCRWATTEQQNRNKRTNKSFTHDGKTMILIEWAEYLGIDYQRLMNRILLGWDFADAIDQSIEKNPNGYPPIATNKSGCTGVSFHKERGVFRASIFRDGKKRHLGSFANIEDAIAARKSAEAVMK